MIHIPVISAGSTLTRPAEIKPATNGPIYRALRLISEIEQRRITAGRCGIDGECAFVGKSRDIVWAPGLRPGTRKSIAAEGLNTDHGAYHIAVYVSVTDGGALEYLAPEGFQSGLHAQRQSIVGVADGV